MRTKIILIKKNVNGKKRKEKIFVCPYNHSFNRYLGFLIKLLLVILIVLHILNCIHISLLSIT